MLGPAQAAGGVGPAPQSLPRGWGRKHPSTDSPKVTQQLLAPWSPLGQAGVLATEPPV